MKEYGGVEVPLIRNLCTRCRAVVSLTPRHLTCGVRAAGTHEIRVWVDAKGCLGVLKERKMSCRCQELNQNPSVSYNPVEFSTGFDPVTKNEFVF